MRINKYFVRTGCLMLCAWLTSCLKDKGNYDYKNVDDLVVVKGIDTIYFVDVLNDSFSIHPVVTTMQGEPIDTSRYTYSWQLNQRLQGAEDYPNLTPLSTSFNLDIPRSEMVSAITNASVRGNLFGAYSSFFRVTDKATGLFKDTYFNIVFSSLSYSGWLLLCDPGDGTSRLSMVAPLLNDTLVKDILASTRSAFPMNAKPAFIAVDYQVRFKPISGPHPFIGTQQNIAILGKDTMEYQTPRYDLKNYITGLEPGTDFATVKFFTTGYTHYIYNNGNFYGIDEYGANRFVQGNKLNNVKFKASRFISITYEGAIVFNENSKTFLRNPLDSFCLEMPTGTLFDFATKQNLRYMEYAPTFNGGEVFAVLDSASKVNLARFSYDGIQSYYNEFTAPDIDKAELFAIDDRFGIVFYSTGGKLYQYSMADRKATLVHDYGDHHITVLKSFTSERDIFGGQFGNVVVCTYNASDPDSGTFDLYSNPELNGSMKLQKSYKHTGKIVDVAYK